MRLKSFGVLIVMKKVKFIFIFFLIWLLFIFSGEFFQYYLSIYTSQVCYIDISESEEYTQAEIMDGVFTLASKHGVDVFNTVKTSKSGRQFSVAVYGTSDVFDKLKNEYSVDAGTYNAVFSGKTKVDFADYKSKEIFAETERYYFIGENKQIQLLDQNLDYMRSPVKAETEHAYPHLILLIWVIIGVLFLILTWLDIHFQKKENFVLISLGKPVWQIILKNIITDFICFSVIFAGLYALIDKFAYIRYEIKNVILICLAVLLLNSLLYLTLLKINYKEVLYGANLNERIISDGYVLKSISMILTIAVLSCNVILISANFKELKRIKTLSSVENHSFLELKPYSLLNYGEDYEENRNGIINSLYSELKRKSCAYSFCGLTGKTEYCFVNSDSKFLLNNFDCELSQNSNIDFYILVPENLNSSAEVDEAVRDCIDMYFGTPEKFNCEKVTYKGNSELLLYDNAEEIALGAENVENPVVIYVNNPSVKLNCGSALADLFGKMLFNINGNNINGICEKYQINEKGFYLQGMTLKEKVADYQSVLNRALLLNTVVSVFLMLLELFIISVIIKLEYKVSTTLLAVKKVLGYSVFQKNKMIFMLNTYATLIAVVSCVVISLMYKLSLWYIVIAVGALVLCFEYFIITILINRFEKQNVAKILKGGCL